MFVATLSLSADGLTLAVGAPAEDSSAKGVNGDQRFVLCSSLVMFFSYSFLFPVTTAPSILVLHMFLYALI